MGLTTSKLKFKSGGVEHSCDLFDSQVDAGSRYLAVQTASGVRYAAIGPTTIPSASKLRVRGVSAESSVLTTSPIYKLWNTVVGGFAASGGGVYYAPADVDSDGNVVNANRYLNQITKLAPDGTVMWTIGQNSSTGSDTNTTFKTPTYATFSGSEVYVADSGNSKLKVYSSADGSWVRTVNIGAGESNYRATGGGNYVTSTADVFKVYDSSGTLLNTYNKTAGTGSGLSGLIVLRNYTSSLDGYIICRDNLAGLLLFDASGVQQQNFGLSTKLVAGLSGTTILGSYEPTVGTHKLKFFNGTDGSLVREIDKSSISPMAMRNVSADIIGTGGVLALYLGESGTLAHSKTMVETLAFVGFDGVGNLYTFTNSTQAITKWKVTL